MKPKCSICLLGIKFDFSKLKKNPNDVNKSCVTLILFNQLIYVSDIIKESSIYPHAICPNCLKCAYTGLRIFVKILGADESPLGRTLN